jgi:hypothetical protein
MKIAYVLLYIFGSAGQTVEAPQRFTSMEKCKASLEHSEIWSSASGWKASEQSTITGICVPIAPE